MKRLSLLSLTVILFAFTNAQRNVNTDCICLSITARSGVARQYFDEQDLDFEQAILPAHRMLATSSGIDLSIHRPNGIYYGLSYSTLRSMDVRRKIKPTLSWDRLGGSVESKFLAGTFGVKLLRSSKDWRAMMEGSLGLLWTSGQMAFNAHFVSFSDQAPAAQVSPSIVYIAHHRIAIGLKGTYHWSSYPGEFRFSFEDSDNTLTESREVISEQWSAQLSLSYLVDL